MIEFATGAQNLKDTASNQNDFNQKIENFLRARAYVRFVSRMYFSNPLRRSEESIKSRILKDSPYGTPFEEVIRIVELKKYDDVSINRETGFIHQGVRPMKLVGVKSIRASLGDYQGIPFQANVTAFWGFDSESKLIEIWVWKTSDGL